MLSKVACCQWDKFTKNLHFKTLSKTADLDRFSFICRTSCGCVLSPTVSSIAVLSCTKLVIVASFLNLILLYLDERGLIYF